MLRGQRLTIYYSLFTPQPNVTNDMPRKFSAISPDWWDYTTLDQDLIDAVARLLQHFDRSTGTWALKTRGRF